MKLKIRQWNGVREKIWVFLNQRVINKNRQKPTNLNILHDQVKQHVRKKEEEEKNNNWQTLLVLFEIY